MFIRFDLFLISDALESVKLIIASKKLVCICLKLKTSLFYNLHKFSNKKKVVSLYKHSEPSFVSRELELTVGCGKEIQSQALYYDLKLFSHKNYTSNYFHIKPKSNYFHIKSIQAITFI